MKSRIVLVTKVNSDKTLDVFKALSESTLIDQVDLIFHRPDRSFKSRLKSQIKNIKHHGPIWVPYRAYVFLRDILRKPSDQESESQDLLSAVEKEKTSSILTVRLLNSKQTRDFLKKGKYDLGVVFGSGILRESVFSIPKKGMINIHQGLIPKYRGMPPAFWELYNGESETGISIHNVVSKIDLGPVYFQETINIKPSDTEDSLLKKLHLSTVANIRETTELVLSGREKAIKLDRNPSPPYTRPTVLERLKLARKDKCLW